jgi:serine/threonine-protein kinase
LQEQVTILNGRYRLGEQIGEGGMSVVYRALDQLLNRTVAIKVLRSQYAADEGFLRRFEREAQSAGGLSHPNIVNVYDVGRHGDIHYIVMEYIRGPSLKELIRRQGPFSVDGAVFIISQVASALDYAHQRGLIHRDIKPQNILVDREGNAKVVDFGIAKGTQDVNLTEAGTGMGTVHYVSPEQARGEPVTAQSDLYSTGVVLFEMLTKRLPFEADTPVGVAMQHVSNPPPLPSQFNPNVPPEVDAIVLRALAKDPRDRFANGAALASSLRNWDAPPIIRADTPAGVRTISEPYPAATRARPVAGEAAVAPLPERRYAAKRDDARDDVGCATWIIGIALFAGIFGLIVLAFRLGPGLFDDDDDTAPTPTRQSSIFPTIGLNETSTPSQAVVIASPTTDGQPTPTFSPGTTPTTTQTSTSVPTDATATSAPTETATVEPSPTEVVPLVPELINASLETARPLIEGTWQLAVINEPSQSVPAGVIMDQEPAPGTPLPTGDTVTVYVSSGPPEPTMVDIPDVRGLEAGNAQQILESAGFVVAYAEERSSSVPAGLVIRTEPSGQAPPGSTVGMIVSLGDLIDVPNVLGEDISNAIAIFEGVGLVVSDVIGVPCETVQVISPGTDCDSLGDRTVVETTPSGGAVVESGTSATLVFYDASLD